MCDEQLYSQCETTQVPEYGSGAALFGYSKLYGEVAGGQAEYLRVPQAQFTHIKVPDGPADERFVYLSDVLPTAWQAVEYAGDPRRRHGRRARARPDRRHGDPHRHAPGRAGDRRRPRAGAAGPGARRAAPRSSTCASTRRTSATSIRDLTDGRGADSVIDAVGMEAHGSPVPKLAQTLAGLLPDALAEPMMQKVGVDRLTALYSAIDIVRRGGTISLSGVYGGAADPLPMLTMFDKQIQLRMGQANVKRWVDDIMPLLDDDDRWASRRSPPTASRSTRRPRPTRPSRRRQDGAVKCVMTP